MRWSSLMQAQLAQERYRADNRSYGDLAAIGLRAELARRPLRDRGRGHAADGYELGRHRHRPAGARHDLQDAAPVVAGGSVVYASGPDAAASNAAAVNRKCWNQ